MHKEKRLTLIEHLDELRKRIIICLIATVASSSICYLKSKELLELIIRPLPNAVFISPVEVFVVYIKVSLFCGLVLACPIILFQVWKFVAIALTKSERKYLAYIVPSSVILFLVGGMFAYFIIIPFSVKFLLGLASEHVVAMISVNRFINFVGILTLATGAIFELPLVILFLSSIGLVTPKKLRSNYKFVIVLVFIIAAMITPTPDVFTQLLVALPMLLLYEVSIWLSHIPKGPKEGK